MGCCHKCVSHLSRNYRQGQRILPGKLLAQGLADIGQVVGAIDQADKVQRVDLADFLAVDIGGPVTHGELAGTVLRGSRASWG